MKKAVTVDESVASIPDGATLMIGGFMGIGSPHRMIESIIRKGTKDLTVIANDTARPNYGIGKLISSGQVNKVIASHIGLNPETQKKMIAGEIKVELIPQGNLAERIRAAGFGLGGVLVKTGLGTSATEGQQVIEINGEQWLLQLPIHADYALIHAHQADYLGNLTYQLTATNFNPVMAMAGKTVLCEANEIVPIGMISPNDVMTPASLVDVLVGMPIQGH